jgi:hypothetical protein
MCIYREREICVYEERRYMHKEGEAETERGKDRTKDMCRDIDIEMNQGEC